MIKALVTLTVPVTHRRNVVVSHFDDLAFLLNIQYWPVGSYSSSSLTTNPLKWSLNHPHELKPGALQCC